MTALRRTFAIIVFPAVAFTCFVLPTPAQANAYVDPLLFRTGMLGNTLELGVLGPATFRGSAELMLGQNASVRFGFDMNVKREPHGIRTGAEFKFGGGEGASVTALSIPLWVYPKSNYVYYGSRPADLGPESRDTDPGRHVGLSSGLFFSHSMELGDYLSLELAGGPRFYQLFERGFLLELRVASKIAFMLPPISFLNPHFVIAEINFQRGIFKDVDPPLNDFDISLIGAFGYRAYWAPFFAAMALHVPFVKGGDDDEYGLGVMFHLGMEFYSEDTDIGGY